MASRAAVNAYVATTRDISALLLDELQAITSDIGPDDTLVSILARVDAAVPQLVDEYGEFAAATAADFYDELRAAAGPVQRFRATLAGPVPHDAIREAVRSSLRDWGAEGVVPSQTLDGMNQMLEDVTIRRGRRTIVKSIARDSVKPMWARVPAGKTTCGWCLMLASRGVGYHSFDAARHSHSKCDCTVTPFWDGDKLPAGYDPDALRDEWDTAAAQVSPRLAGEKRMKAILAKLRETSGVD